LFPQLNAQLSIKTIAVNLVSFTLNEPPGGGHDTREKDIQAKDTQYNNKNAILSVTILKKLCVVNRECRLY
jgi:hypothetical protein